MNRQRLTLGMAAAALLSSSAISAQSNNRPEFSVGLEAGAEHVSNLTVTELDTAADASDIAALFEAGADMNWQPGAGTNLGLGYNYSASRHRDLSLYDLDMHLLYADLSHDFAQLTIGGNAYHAEADLDGRRFMRLRQYSLYAGRLFANQYYLRGSVNLADRSFPDAAGRKADNQGFGLDMFRFFNQGRSNILLAWQFDDEATRADEFEYRGNTLRLRFNHNFQLVDRNTQWQIGYRWQNRAYRNVTPQIDKRRDDTWHIIDSQLTIDLNNYLQVIGRWEYGDYQSNLALATYRSSRLSAVMRLHF